MGKKSKSKDKEKTNGTSSGNKIPPQLLKGLKEIEVKPGTLNNDKFLDEDSEVFLVTVHGELPELLGQKIDLVNGTELQDTSVLSFPSKITQFGQPETLAVLLSDDQKFELASREIKGHLVIRPKLENMEMCLPKLSRRKKTKLPKGLKMRHPIYGIDPLPPPPTIEDLREKKRKASSPPQEEHKKKKKKSRH